MDYVGRQGGQERVRAAAMPAISRRIFFVKLASREINIAKLKNLALEFELTMDIDALHGEADLDKSGTGKCIHYNISMHMCVYDVYLRQLELRRTAWRVC